MSSASGEETFPEIAINRTVMVRADTATLVEIVSALFRRLFRLLGGRRGGKGRGPTPEFLFRVRI